MNILITRPLIDSEDLMGKLFSLGHKIIHIPTLKISPAKTESVDLNEYDAIILSVAHEKIIALGVDKIREFGKPTHILYDLKYLFSKNESDMRL